MLVRVAHLELAEWADGAADEHVLPRDLPSLACKADAHRVDLLELVLELVLAELAAARTEGVRLDELGAGANVARVHGDDALGRADVRLLRAPEAGDGAGEERAEATVGDDGRAAAKALEEISHGSRPPAGTAGSEVRT